jgi:hypothetical protein
MQNTAVQAGSADVSVIVRAFVASTGLPATTITNATSGLEIRYKRGATGAVTTLAPASQTSTGAHADGGIVHLHGGAYRVDLPDAAVADGVPFVTVTVAGVADTVFTVAQLALTDGDPLAAPLGVDQVADQVVRLLTGVSESDGTVSIPFSTGTETFTRATSTDNTRTTSLTAD